jgi:hypothetical protein
VSRPFSKGAGSGLVAGGTVEPLGATYCLHVRSERLRRDAADRVDFGPVSLYCAQPKDLQLEPFPWSHANGGGESTQGARLTMRAQRGQFITVLYPGPLPPVGRVSDGVRVGDDEVRFGGDFPRVDKTTVCVRVTRAGREILRLTGDEVDLDRSQGHIGLFVPDAGYPFGEIPDWLVRQRADLEPSR